MDIADLSFLSLHRDLKLDSPLKIKVQRYNEGLIQSFASQSSISKARSHYYQSAHSCSFSVEESKWPGSDSSSSSSSDSEVEDINTCGKRFYQAVGATRITPKWLISFDL